MFAADLSWQMGESVGQRRERKARERPSGTPSVRTSMTSRSSSSNDRQEWWTSGLNKIKAKTSSKSSGKGRPVTSPSSNSQQTSDPPPLPLVRETIARDRPTWDSELPHHLKEQVPNPAYTFSKSLSPTLPSGGSMDILECDVPELEGDISSRYTHSIVSHRRTIVPRIETRMDEDYGPQKTSSLDTARHIEVEPKVAACRPLAQWDSLSPMMVPKDFRRVSASRPVKATGTQHNTIVRTRFQRFMQRLESAGPQLVLDRMKESQQDSADSEEELLEQQLWLLTGFQLQNLGKARVVPKPQCDTGKILELYGNLCNNVSYLTVREFGTVPLPYPEDYFSHIRASTLPSLVPSAKLPELFRECYKLLAPGGLLEIRIMDAAPVRRTAGPMMRMWIEDRLSVNLEKLFRCSKPCSLVSGWLAEAGFQLSEDNDQGLQLPCAFDPTSNDVEQELSTMIGQALWKDIWGPFVQDFPDEPKWWWEEDIIVQECLKRKTVLECRSLYAYKI
ncbi:uncharacterized protein M421DRAFT_57553 [Didymella exigua CBS 183.55]|uniref:Methyltransferase type 11 domain-containing protein n=1 Tax=Didymella exigua CBS 183.55 TaxID=1150837 RepID=A0A6A5RWP2_9PLEO|nr:uncharacterized protein M421DRAFT_57553 [Didymella exigua CBS 183.55]KAF1930696.1 hypothetical protein M421DRAFT_57553 [Didymella exigua CBS 183.55]